MDSTKKNMPSWDMHSRTALSWFKGREVDFQARSSPAPTVYYP